MNKELEKKTKMWMELERKTLEQRKEADSFYDTELMDLIEEEFISANKDLVFENVPYLIVSVGTSYEPIVLSIKLLQPENILFLYTEVSGPVLDKVIAYCDIPPARYEKSLVNEVDPIDIYREVKRVYLKWRKPERMYIDFTGGTKAMSAACALAGSMIDIQMIYVSSSDYLVDFRKPTPGSEELVYIENPVAVFGDLEYERATELFGKYNFAGAADKLGSIKDRIPDPELRQQMQFVYLLARAYEAWDALEFEKAWEQLSVLQRELTRDRRIHPEYILMDCLPTIKRQTAILEHLREIPVMQHDGNRTQILETKQVIHALMFTMHLHAMTRETQEKYDMATLLLYRLLEMIEQRRLIHYRLYASAPEYGRLEYDVSYCPELKDIEASNRLSWLKDRVLTLKKGMFKNADSYLPNQIALLDGFTILAALKDPLIMKLGKTELVTLKRIRSMVYMRNNSIFAHGLGPVGKDDYTKFRRFVEEVFAVFCGIEKIDHESSLKVFQWINPLQSENNLKEWEVS